MTPAVAYCRSCDDLRRNPDVLPATCGECGGYLSARLAVVASWHPSRGVDGFLRDLTALRLARLAVPGPRSGAGAALDAASSGVFGTGCRGSKGAGAPVAPEHRPLPARHPAEGRYRALRGEAATVAALIVEGVVVYSAGEAAKVDGVSLTVDQSVGWFMLTDAERKVVRQKIATRDRRPALTRMEYVGVAALDAAAKEWVR